MQFARRELEAVGAEAFLPPNETDSLALFAVEELRRGAIRYEAGLRLESTDVSTDATGPASGLCADPRDRDFTTVSGSFGVLWLAGDEYAVGGSPSASSS